MKIATWNVNGIRAAQKKGFIEWFSQMDLDILCLQETKAEPEQLDNELLKINNYKSIWNSAIKKGYSGVACYYKPEPIEIAFDLPEQEYNQEGRLIVLKYPEFSLLNVYFPNGQMSEDRLQYKLDFYDVLIKYCNELKAKNENIIVCGDFNTAHQEIDLKNPKANENRSGFLAVERKKLDEFLAYGYVDVFRKLYPDKVQYTWWSYRSRARERNAGWRIDAFYLSEDFMPKVKDCVILDQVVGSDHCPLILFLEL